MPRRRLGKGLPWRGAGFDGHAEKKLPACFRRDYYWTHMTLGESLLATYDSRDASSGHGYIKFLAAAAAAIGATTI